jgi:hypothetical protein
VKLSISDKRSREGKATRMTMKILVLLLLLVFWPSRGAVHGQTPSPRSKVSSGSICLATITPPNSEQKSLANPSGGNRISSYSVQVDKRKALTTSKDKSINVSGLAVDRRHLVKIFGDGRPVESFWFNFSEFSTTKLCLWFNSLYQTWQLWDAKDGGAKCKCNR